MTQCEKQTCETLRLLRASKGMSIKELGERTGLSCNTIYCIENQKKAPSLKIMKKYETFFSVSPGFHPLLCRERKFSLSKLQPKAIVSLTRIFFFSIKNGSLAWLPFLFVSRPKFFFISF